MKMKYVLPLVIFLALAIFLMVGLNRGPERSAFSADRKARPRVLSAETR